MVHQHGHDIIVVTVCGRDLLSDDSCLEREGGGGGGINLEFYGRRGEGRFSKPEVLLICGLSLLR